METRFKKLACELQGGHEWSQPIVTEDALFNKIVIIICVHCSALRDDLDLEEALVASAEEAHRSTLELRA